MSCPLDFQTEGPGFESHQVHMLFFLCVFFTLFSSPSQKNALILINVVFFVLIKIEISIHGTFSSIAIDLKSDGQRILSNQKLDGPSWRAEMKVQHHMYAVFKCIAFQLHVPYINSPHFKGLKNYIYILNICIML